MRPVWSSFIAVVVATSCHATPPPSVTLAQITTAANPVVTQASPATLGVVPEDLGTNEQRVVGYTKDDTWLGYEISTCDPCPSEFHFEAKGQEPMALSYYYDPGNHDDEKEKATNADVDAKLAKLGLSKAVDARALRGPFPYPDLKLETKTESDPSTGDVTLSFGANGVFPMKVTLGPMPLFSQVPADERDQYILDPMLVYANVTRDGSEIGIVVIARGPMWYEAGAVSRMRTTDFIARVRPKSSR